MVVVAKTVNLIQYHCYLMLSVLTVNDGMVDHIVERGFDLEESCKSC